MGHWGAKCYRSSMSRIDGRRGGLLLTALALCWGVAFSGCGYRPIAHVGSDATASGAEARRSPTRLAVVAIRNDSPEPWLDRIVTDALRREMDTRGGLTLVSDPQDAELVLRGRVRPLLVQSRSFSSFVAALEYSVTIALDMEVTRTSGDSVRFDPAMLTETEIFFASADIEVTRTNKLEALRRLSDVLAGRIADSIELMRWPGRTSTTTESEGA